MATSKKPKQAKSPYEVRLSLSFLVSAWLAVVATAFAIGVACRTHILPAAPAAVPESRVVRSETLPPPVLKACKNLPNFVYSSKHFETGQSATTDNLLVRKNDDEEPSCPLTVLHADDDDDDEDELQFQPAGQHLLVDIKNVDGHFLNSEGRLAQAMVNLISDSGLTMLSYHCHGLEPIGVSCVGVLLESHVSFHTWPLEGVITFDLFTCGPKSLLPLLPTVKELFGVPRRNALTGPTVAEPHMQWSYKNRGFPRSGRHNPEEAGDLNQMVMGWMEFDMKKQISDVDTDFQNVQVYEVIVPKVRGGLESYQRSLSQDGSYEANNPELFRPERIVYLDHVMQSRLYGEVAYHEALVHPALITFGNPRRVAIIGGGEGATLRECLKYKTVEKVTMVEIDEIMVNKSREFLPEWNSCGDFTRYESCFDDPRSDVYYTDAIAWFVDRYTDISNVKEEDKYDVIIMDAL